ncbi:MAG TPA: hypothetical protein VMX18_03185 [Candidatus Bipolaricaulota bacterium]|nr:hypothetical protein [Candidatus Bipolaricaulota bacterium]
MRNLEKIIKFIQETGDKCIYYDAQSGNNLMIMPLGEYQRILGENTGIRDLTQEELLDRMNRDIALWKVGQDDLRDNWTGDEEISDFAENQEENEEKFYLEPLES